MRKWSVFLIFVVIAFALASCSNHNDNNKGNGSSNNKGSSDNSGEEVELTMGLFGSTGYDVLVDEYMAEHPNIKITINTGEMEDVLDNLFTSISAGSGSPDIALIEVSQIAKFLERSEERRVGKECRYRRWGEC